MQVSQDRCSLIRSRFLPQKRRWMKNFVLHCNRCTVVTGLFNLNFVHIWKEGTLGTRLISEEVFFVWASKFFCSRPTWEKFPTVQNGLGKRRSLYLIKLVSKRKWTIRKGHTSLLFFHFWSLKLVPIDLGLNSVSGN